MKVVVVRAEKRKAPDGPSQEGETGVQNRQAEADDSHDQRRSHRAFVRGGDGKRCDDKSDEIRAAVAEVDSCRREIVHQKPEQ